MSFGKPSAIWLVKNPKFCGIFKVNFHSQGWPKIPMFGAQKNTSWFFSKKPLKKTPHLQHTLW